MKKPLIIVMGLSTLISIFLLGCVSTQKYNDLDEKNRRTEDELAALKRDNEDSNRKIGELENKLNEADMTITAMKTESDTQRGQSVKEIDAVKRTYDSLVKNLEKEISQGKIQVQQEKERLTMKIAEELFFDTGKADIKPEGKEVLVRIGAVLKKIPEKNIRIEGHTDNVPIVSSLKLKYPTNWELGSARATTVVRFFQEETGIDPLRLSAVSYGEFRPVASNRTDLGRSKNRRIEIILIARDLDLAKRMRENLR
ncbi:MAG: OmpA family protein [Spirochaetes bacterium]|nr:OmpA family protein [Spirochaetota bacterium]